MQSSFHSVPDFNNNFVRRNLQKIEKIREIVWQRKSASAVTRQSQIPAAAQALQSTVLSRLQYRRKTPLKNENKTTVYSSHESRKHFSNVL